MINTNKVVDNLKFLGLFVAAMIIMVAFMAPVRIPEWVRIVIIVATVAVMLGVNIVYDQKFAPPAAKNGPSKSPPTPGTGYRSPTFTMAPQTV